MRVRSNAILILAIIAVMALTACNEADNTQHSVADAPPATMAGQEPPANGHETKPAKAEQTGGVSPLKISLEKKTITAAKGQKLEVISVTTAAEGGAKHGDLVAVEGGIANISADKSVVDLNCVSPFV